MTHLLTIDPGMSTGVVLGEFTLGGPYKRLDFWQIDGGLKGLRNWDKFVLVMNLQFCVRVCERFVPLPTARSFKTNELEAIRIEGMIEDRTNDNVVWQRASAQVLAGGDTPAQRKKNSDDVLRRMGLWTTGKQVGQKDANDVNSATKHAVAYLRSIKHEPTLKWLEG